MQETEPTRADPNYTGSKLNRAKTQHHQSPNRPEGRTDSHRTKPQSAPGINQAISRPRGPIKRIKREKEASGKSGDPHLAAPGGADDELRVPHGGASAAERRGEFGVGFREQEARVQNRSGELGEGRRVRTRRRWRRRGRRRTRRRRRRGR